MIYPLFALIVSAAIAASIDEQTASTRTRTPSHASVCAKATSSCAASSDRRQVSAYCSSLLHITTVTETTGGTSVTHLPTCTPPSISGFSTFGYMSSGSANRLVKAEATPSPSPSSAPSCFGSGNPVSSCNCFSFTTHTSRTRVPTATVTGPFAVGVSGTGSQGYQAVLGGYRSRKPGIGINFQEKLPGLATLFTLDENGYLFITPTNATPWYSFLQYNPIGGPPHTAQVVFSNISASGGLPRLPCRIEESLCALRCSVGKNHINQICPESFNVWMINTKAGETCDTFTPLIDPDIFA